MQGSSQAPYSSWLSELGTTSWLWDSAPLVSAPHGCTDVPQGFTLSICVQTDPSYSNGAEHNLGFWFTSLKLLLLNFSQKHRWCCGFLFISVWRLKGGCLGEEGRERTRDGKSEFSRRASHNFIFFFQPLVMAGSLIAAICSRKFPGGFPGIPKCGGLGAQPVTTTRAAVKRMDLS